MRRSPNTFSDTEKSWYGTELRNRYMEKYGQDFENFAGDVFRRVYGGDFFPVSSGGGDDKNDGIVLSEQVIFQCYAPMKYESAAALNRKIEEDYRGALAKWPGDFKTWKLVFCHPKNEGLDKSTVHLIAKLMKEGGPKIQHMGRDELVSFALRMSRDEMILWIGPAPIEVIELGFELQMWEIGHVCRAVAGTDVDLDGDLVLDEVPPTKLEYNVIPSEVRDFLQRGNELSGRVKEFFRTADDPQLGDRVAKHFKEEYTLQRQRHEDNASAIYWGLWDVIRHRVDRLSRETEELAAHAILAYLFNSCDIFERPPADWQGHAS